MTIEPLPRWIFQLSESFFQLGTLIIQSKLISMTFRSIQTAWNYLVHVRYVSSYIGHYFQAVLLFRMQSFQHWGWNWQISCWLLKGRCVFIPTIKMLKISKKGRKSIPYDENQNSSMTQFQRQIFIFYCQNDILMATYITTSVAHEAAWWSNRKNQTPPYEPVS